MNTYLLAVALLQCAMACPFLQHGVGQHIVVDAYDFAMCLVCSLAQKCCLLTGAKVGIAWRLGMASKIHTIVLCLSALCLPPCLIVICCQLKCMQCPTSSTGCQSANCVAHGMADSVSFGGPAQQHGGEGSCWNCCGCHGCCQRRCSTLNKHTGRSELPDSFIGHGWAGHTKGYPLVDADGTDSRSALTCLCFHLRT
jgi:hypothetical protein